MTIEPIMESLLILSHQLNVLNETIKNAHRNMNVTNAGLREIAAALQEQEGRGNA